MLYHPVPQKIEDEDFKCVSCGDLLPADTFDVVCSATCQDLLDLAQGRRNDWDSDPEDSYYN